MIEILPTDNDDSGFTEIVEKILNGFIQDYAPDEIYIVKIDNWFDSRWRLFAGKMLGVAGVRSKELVVPPFIPSRVLEQFYFQKSGNIYEKHYASDIHFYQPSEENLSRKLSAYSGSKMLLWFSGSSKNTRRGSIMIYQIEKEEQYSWYISFLKKGIWQIYKTDQISRNEVLNLI